MLGAYRGVASDIFSARWLGQRVRLDYESKSLPQRVVLLNGECQEVVGAVSMGAGFWTHNLVEFRGSLG